METTPTLQNEQWSVLKTFVTDLIRSFRFVLSDYIRHVLLNFQVIIRTDAQFTNIDAWETVSDRSSRRFQSGVSGWPIDVDNEDGSHFESRVSNPSVTTSFCEKDHLSIGEKVYK